MTQQSVRGGAVVIKLARCLLSRRAHGWLPSHGRRVRIASAVDSDGSAADCPSHSTAPQYSLAEDHLHLRGGFGFAAWPASGAKPDKKKSPCTHSPFFSLLLIDLAEEASATAALRMDASAAAAPDVTPEGATRQFQPVCHGCCTGAVPCRRPGGGCRHRIVCRACVHEEQAWQHGNTAHGSVCNAGWTNGSDMDHRR